MNIFVGNLTPKVTGDDLRAAFEPFGEVQKAVVIYHYETNKSRLFGFVEMPNKEEAEKAIIELQGADLDGRPLRLEEARPWVKRDRPRVQTPENSKWS